jgi:hypothetical protein
MPRRSQTIIGFWRAGFHVRRRGQPVGVWMSVAQYRKLVRPKGDDFWSAVLRLIDWFQP